MELGSTVKRRYFAYGASESLLELAVKLRKAEVRVNGQTLQQAVPPSSVLPGVSSTVGRGRFQFIARRNYVLENFPTSEHSNSSNMDVTTDSVPAVVATNRFSADDEPTVAQEEIAVVSMNQRPKKLSLPNRTGPSLWPCLSSIKSSFDVEHVRFLERNQNYYSNYDESDIAEDYVELLSVNDFEVIIDSAVDVLLQSHTSQQSYSNKNESYVPAAVSVTPLSIPPQSVPPLSLPPLPRNSDMDASLPLETNNISSVSTISQPAVVSKRYAAAVANPRRFKCGLCPYSTNNRSHVRRHHISVHSDARPFRCYVCGKEFARCENAKVHMVSRHPTVPYSIDRLRNNLFYKHENRIPQPTEQNSLPQTNTQSSIMPEQKTAFQLQQDVGSSGIAPQWPTDPKDAEMKTSGLERQTIPPWLTVPKSELSINPNLPVLGNQLLPGIPQGVFPAPANTMLNIQSFLGSVNPIKQELNPPANMKTSGCPVSDRHVCLYCQFMCQSAAELANHIATSHATLNPAFHAAPNASSNPGYVVLQTAAPIFLFPYSSNSALPNKSPAGPGYHPILPKLPVGSDECATPSEASAGQHLSFEANAETASVGHSSTSVPASEQSESPSMTSANLEGKSERSQRQRQLKTFYCTRCPDRAPFRYEKSFEKHLRQHSIEDRSRVQKIASKVA